MTFVFTCQIFNKRSIVYENAHKLHLSKRRSPEKIIVKLFVRFRPLCLRYLQRATHLMQMREFGDVFKALTVSYLNFVDTDLSLKMLLKRPKWACKRATVAAQLWPFQLSSVALLQVRRARMSKSAGFSGSLKPVFRSVWSFLVEVFLLIFFTVIRHLVKMPFTDFCVLSSLTYFDLELKKRLRISSPSVIRFAPHGIPLLHQCYLTIFSNLN